MRLSAILFVSVFLLTTGCVNRDQKTMEQVNKEIDDSAFACQEKRANGELKTHADFTGCINNCVVQAYAKAQYRYMDLVVAYTAKRLVLAEKLDKKKMTEPEMRAVDAELYSEWQGEAQRRYMSMQQANAQQTNAIAAILGNMHPYQAPVPVAPRPTQTNCYGMGNSINCTSQPTGIDTSMYR